MRRRITLATALAVLGLSLTLAPPSWAACNPDAIQVGPTCIDKYEASIWSIPAKQTRLIADVKNGTATLATLTAGKATQISPTDSCNPAFPESFPATGNWTAPLYAVSIPRVRPTACASWFQAAQACALSGKRLLSNQEWQQAAAGTPDSVDNGTTGCNFTEAGGPINTGSRSACVSRWGAFDMVGNVEEWVADWTPPSSGSCGTELFGTGDTNCLAGTTQTAGTAALVRGGGWDGTNTGVFAVSGRNVPSVASAGIGFRCAR